MPTKVSAAVLRTFGEPVQIEEIALDDPDAHEVIVRVAACGVCHSDLHFQCGAMGGALPTVMGHEPAGIVETVGMDVTLVKPGDHVIACDSLYCGSCPQCTSGRLYLCTNRRATRRSRDSAARVTVGGDAAVPFADLGGMAEAMLVHERALVPIDDDIPLDRAALLGCAMVTGLGAALNTASVHPGATVAVFGCGGVGTAVLQGARIAGARRVIAIDVVEAKLEMAAGFGATDTILSGDNDVAAVRELTGGGVDFAFDAVGHPDILRHCFAALAARGVAVLVGAPPPTPIEIDPRHLMLEKKLTGSFMGSNRFPLDIPYYLDLYRQGRLDLDSMVSERLPLTDLNHALGALGRGEVLTRSVITFSS